MTPPDNVEPHSSTVSQHDEMRVLALTMERMAGELASLKSTVDRSESLLEGIANRLAVLASRSRPQPVTKEELQPILAGLLRYLERHDRTANDGR